jgi:hypothetical protein
MAQAELITAGMVRGYDVMTRRTMSYDYEKVFWNSAFGLGLVGLGWVAIKLGKEIRGYQTSWDQLTEQVAKPDTIGYYQYLKLFSWVEGENRARPTWDAEIYMWGPVYLYRADPDNWEAYKEAVAAAHPDWFLNEAGKPTVQVAAADKVLNFLDDLYAKYGGVMPIGVLAGNVGFEYARVWRLKREMRV